MKLTCKQMAELATDWAERALDAATRAAFDAHLEVCVGCRTYVGQLELTRQALHRLPALEVSPGLEQSLLAGFDAWSKDEPEVAAVPGERVARRRGPSWSVAGTLGTLVLLVAFAHQRSQSPRDWIVAGGLAAVALALSALAGRLAMGMVAAAVGAAIVASLVGGGAGALSGVLGAECLATELVAAGLVAVVAWIAARRESRSVIRAALAAGVVAGALAADAALQLACPAHDALAHLLVFHLGGVALAGVAAVALLRSGRAAARA